MSHKPSVGDFDPERLVALLCDAGVRVVLIGGFAAITHGSSRYTQDFGFVYDRTPDA